jgi:hypothetical protein
VPEANISGVCEVRQSKAKDSDKAVNQTYVTALGASMIGAHMATIGMISVARYQDVCASRELPMRPVAVSS